MDCHLLSGMAATERPPPVTGRDFSQQMHVKSPVAGARKPRWQEGWGSTGSLTCGSGARGAHGLAVHVCLHVRRGVCIIAPSIHRWTGGQHARVGGGLAGYRGLWKQRTKY